MSKFVTAFREIGTYKELLRTQVFRVIIFQKKKKVVL